jgi:putative oxidoreductase
MTRSLMNNVLARCSHLIPSLRETWYAIPLRLIVGCGFMEHGCAKLARGPDSFAGILHSLGMPAPMLLSQNDEAIPIASSLDAS